MNPHAWAADALRERLSALAPLSLEIGDDSAQHAGHSGARDGGHFSVLIVSAYFAGLPTMQRHRLVYDAAGDLMQRGIHALSIKARTPEESDSPHADCLIQPFPSITGKP